MYYCPPLLACLTLVAIFIGVEAKTTSYPEQASPNISSPACQSVSSSKRNIELRSPEVTCLIGILLGCPGSVSSKKTIS